MNLPLDVRTPAYSDYGTAAQSNIETIWDFNFWKQHLDGLARNRYNLISIWGMHPFPSMVKVPEYPEVALDDVMKADFTNKELREVHSTAKGTGKNAITDFVLSKKKIIKKITIDEKIKFWKRVMQYGKNRGFEFHIMTWNLFTWGATGKHGITQDAANPISQDYIRKTVVAMFETYPLLAGIGVTAGENMGPIPHDKREMWLWKTYGLGFMDVLNKNPNRKLRFIHRFWNSNLQDIVNNFQPMIDCGVNFDFSFKYACARLYSSTKPIYSDTAYNELPKGTRMWNNLRNDDIYTMRWANPDYVREFILNLPSEEKSPGFYMGSDGYVWGKEFTSKHPKTFGKLEIEKHWLRFMLWGRLAFNPKIDNELFKEAINKRFKTSEKKLFSAWQETSKIIPLINKFYWHSWDVYWNVESCSRNPSKKRAPHSVLRFIDGNKMKGSNYYTVKEYCDLALNHKITNKISPLDVANQLDIHAEKTLNYNLKSNFKNQELIETIGDIKAMAILGQYYSDKIKGAVNLCFYQKTKNIDYKIKSIKYLQKALIHCGNYVKIHNKQYKSQLLSRGDWIDMESFIKLAQDDISIVRNTK